MATPDTTRTERSVRRHGWRALSAVALSSVAALALTVTGNAFAGGSDPLSDSSARLSDAAAQAANTASGAGSGPSDATVSGTQPNGSNDASSAQPPSSGEVPAPEAVTQQAATALADATQNNVQNIVIIIRINSPGNDVISQSNNAIASAVATNTATTRQGSGGAESAAPLKVATAGTERARPRAAAVQRPPGRAGASRPTIGPEHSASTGVRAGSKSSQQYGAAPKVAPRQAVAAAPRSASAPSTRENRPLVTSVPAHIGRAATRAGTDAAHFVSSFAPLGAPAEKADSVSTAVVLTLFAVMLAVLLGLGSTYVPWLRARAWR